MKQIKYIGYYSIPTIQPERFIPLAGRNKMDYTIEVLKRIFDDIEIISPACTKRGEPACSASVAQLSKHIRLKLFSMFANTNRVAAHINSALVKLKLLLYLIKNCCKNEPVLVYHSLALINTILLAKRIKKFKLILELNEIYSDVSASLEHKRKSENKIINAADAFLFANEQLNGIFNHRHLPYAVEYGVYTPSKQIVEKFNDGKIHVVYAGTFDPAKGGGIAAAKAAEFLPKRYHMHILGFGSENQIREIENTVTKIKKLEKCEISYDGKLDGVEFINFLQKCHIGLSTQNPNAAFNATSFPSKILTYLANGLQVVSIDIPAISESKLSDAITFYKDQTPEAIAEAIQKISIFESHDTLLNQLDRNLTSSLKELFDSLRNS